MISEDRLSKALAFLATTDEASAELKVQMLRKEYICDLVRKRIFLIADGNNEERKAKAETSGDVQDAINTYLDATAEFEKVRAKRTTEALIVEVWRTQSANQRQGNV